MENKKKLEEYKKIGILSQNYYSIIYKVKNKISQNYYALEEIDKKKFKQYTNHDFGVVIKSNKKNIEENYMFIKDTLDFGNKYYIIMELFVSNLKDYIYYREKALSINEVKSILHQLNHLFNKMSKISLSNILICINEIDQITLKIIKYENNNLNNNNINEEEYLLEEKNMLKDLGMEIFYMLYKKYPLNENKEIDIKIIENKIEEFEIKDLLIKMLNKNEKFFWNDYLNHSFNNIVDLKKIRYPSFSFLCKDHSIKIDSFCETCQDNICVNCFKEKHSFHKVIPFSKIGLTQEEKNEKINALNRSKEALQILFNIQKEISKLFEEIEQTNQNLRIYDKNPNKNFKKFYINYLNVINEIIESQNNVNLIDLDYSYIECEYSINNIRVNKNINIINCCEGAKSFNSKIKETPENYNEEEIKNNCELFLENKPIDFSFKHIFEKEGIYKLKIIFKKPLTNINCLFFGCSTSTNIDLSNFNTNKITNMKRLFCFCSALDTLNLSSFNTTNVNNMHRMFSTCSNLKQINIENFNTINVTDMNGMFHKCSSLINLELNNFNTENVIDMKEMFCDCQKLETLDLSSFHTEKVEDMEAMFCNCFKLNTLNIFNFKINKLTRLEDIFDKLNKDCKINVKDNILLRILR